jgi:hypothetical protein
MTERDWLHPEEFAPITEWRLGCHGNGYPVVPVYSIFANVNSAGKRPGPIPDWQKKCLTATPDEIRLYAQHYPNCPNTGIVSGAVLGVDIDVLHPECSAKILAKTVELLGPTPLQRVGRAPRTLYVYRAETLHEKISTPYLFFDDNFDKDNKAVLEVLASGQQFLGDGLHPVTREPYYWLGQTPLDVPAAELPVASLDKLKQLVAEAEKILRAAGARTEAEIRDDINRREHAGAEYTGYSNEKPGHDEIESALRAVPNTFDRLGYIRIGYAVYDAIGEAGAGMFRSWAKDHPSYNKAHTSSDWKSFKKGRVTTYRTLLWHAYENGWKSPKAGKFSGKNSGGAKPRPETPQPLFREIPQAGSYPIDALKHCPVLHDAILAMHEKIQSPIEISAMSALAAACLAVQGHADVRLPSGLVRPISCLFLTIAKTGERKTPNDREALRSISKREKELKDEYKILKDRHKNAKDAWERQRDKIIKNGTDQLAILAELDAHGPEPEAPLLPYLIHQEPTIEGLVKACINGRPSVGVFSDEGATFIGGHALSEDAKLRTAGTLSQFWDGGVVKRTRAGDGALDVQGRRVAVHLMMQPEIAQKLLSDPELSGQGLLSRFLISAPESTAGGRIFREAGAKAEVAIQSLENALLAILRKPLPIAHGTQNELDPHALGFASDARELWIMFYNGVEELLGPAMEYAPIRDLGNKLAEHAGRIAGVIAKVRDFETREISADDMVAGIEIAEYHANEALRLYRTGRTNPDLVHAQTLLDWLQRPKTGSPVTLRDIYRLGPNSIREKAVAEKLVNILIDHAWLDPEVRPSADGKRETTYYHFRNVAND